MRELHGDSGAGAGGSLEGEDFGNQDLSGAPVAVVDEGTAFVDHSWVDGGPAGLTDHFSARFTRTVSLPAGRYRFTVTTDDGSRLWVDEQLRINEWWAQGPTPYAVEIDLEAGTHTLRYEYFEQTGGATAQLTWALLTPVVLASGEALWENQTRVSLDGAYRLQYQGDGNLVVVRLADESCGWSSQTNGTSVGATIMQGDGNLVVYNGDWTAVWNAGTSGHDGARLEIANDELAVVAADGTKLWWVSLAAEPHEVSAGVAMATVPSAPGGPSGRAAGVLIGVIALFGLAACVARRRWFGLEPHARLRLPVCGGQAAGRRAQAARRLRAQLSATALLLAAMLLVPATALAQIPTQEVEYYHTDVLGSVRAVTKQVNGQWQVVARHDFMPFGEEVAPPTPPQDKRLFTGKERDNETGLDYFEARYLRTAQGRFTTADPIGVTPERMADPQRLNRYTYVRNNPLVFVDPDGRDVRSYTEYLPKAVVGFPWDYGYPRHSYTVVTTETGRYLLELTGAGAVNTQIPSYEGWGDRDIRGGRQDVRTSLVVRPKDSPEGDFKFERRILFRAAVLNLDFPTYHPRDANCNEYARWLIESSGGQVMQPFTVWFTSTDVFEERYRQNLTIWISRVVASVSLAMAAGTF